MLSFVGETFDNPTNYHFMLKTLLLLFLQIVLTVVLLATSNHTITIDGNNNEWDADETFTNISHDGSSDTRNAYFTWDADFIYIGISDVEADRSPLATFVYFDIDPTSSNGTTNAYAWGHNITTPFSADWVVVFKNGYSNQDYIEVMNYNGSNWVTYDSEPALQLLSGGGDTLVKFAIGTDYREVKIKRSMIGNPEAIKTCMFSEGQWDATHWRYLAWPHDPTGSPRWNDAGRAENQQLYHYYGFLLEDNIAQTSAPYYDANIVSWTGASSSSWATNGNWTGGTAPDQNTLVLLPATATTTIDASGASCYDMSITSGGVLTLSIDGELSVGGNLYNTVASGVVVQSTSSGNGSLIVEESNTAQATIQNYVSAGQWHSWSAPVSGLTAYELYLNASPEVWLTEYDEATKGYTYISAFTEPLGDMKGWMLWIGGSTANTYNFEGPLHTGTFGSDNNMVRSASGDYGFNYIGNPYSSAIDWEATGGWTKTNLNDAIYIYNNGSWTTYINGTGVLGGSRYIAMNQGFFVQVSDGAGSYPEYGTLKMDNDVCVHNSVGFLKETETTTDSLIRVQVSQNGIIDEAVIRFNSDATAGFDGQFDAVKFFSYVEDRPQIYSSANNGMAINTLPSSIEIIDINVLGIDGQTMTIGTTELIDITNVYLEDNFTGIITNIGTDEYSFIYDKDISNRFTVYLTITNSTEVDSKLVFKAFSTNNNIKFQFYDSESYSISVTNLLGQKVYQKDGIIRKAEVINLKPGIYIVKVNSATTEALRKVIVK